MGSVRQSFLFLPQHLWDVMFDPDMWSINTQGFAPTLSRRFVIKDPPALGTRFTGCFQCEITDVQPCRRVEFAATALTWLGPPCDLIDTFEFVELPGETHCTFTVCGADENDPAERLLDHMITESIHWGFHYINRKLERRTLMALRSTARLAGYPASNVSGLNVDGLWAVAGDEPELGVGQ